MLYRVSAGHDQLVLPAAGGSRELMLAELHDVATDLRLSHCIICINIIIDDI